ncbi:MAG TPA: Ig-like domain-containing protein [Pyrinomonadaceae bacterium]
MKVNPGDTITYTVTIRNSAGAGDATGVNFADTVDGNTTLVAGSTHAQPIAVGDTYTTVANTVLEVGVTPSGFPAVSASGSAFDNDSQPNNTGGTDVSQYVSNTSPSNGTVTFNSDGTFSYLPNVGFVGSDSFTYTVRNSNANSMTDTATVNITVSPAGAGPTNVIWYVDNSYTGSNGASDGRSTRPYTTLTPVNGVAGAGDSDNPGDIIYLSAGNAAYTTGLQLENSEQFIGSGVALVVNTLTLKAAGARPTLGNTLGSAITLASGNTVTGLNTGTTAAVGAAITGNNFGTAAVNNLAINSGAARALDLTNGTLAFALDSVASSGTGTGINLSNTAGTLTVAGAVTINNTAGINVAGASFPTVNFNTSLSVTSTAGAGITAAGGTFNIAGASNTIGSTSGPAVSLTNVNLGSGATFSSVSSSGSATNGLKFDNVAGSFTANGGSIGTAAGTDVDINNGSGNITYAGSITNTAGRSVSITNRTGGTVSITGTISDTGTGLLAQNNTTGTPTFNFSGSSKSFNTGTNPAVTLDNNDNATINFTNGNLTITTTSGAGFNALNGASAINVSGTGNTISTGTGTALSVVNSSIGSSGLTFQTIGSNGAPSGIVLTTTGTAGGLTVTGNSAGQCGGAVTVNAVGTPATVTAPATADCTGGTIQNSTGNGISVTAAGTVSLTRVRVVNSGGHGIHMSGGTGFTLASSFVTDNTGLITHNGVNLSNLSGTVAVTNSTVGPTPEHGLVMDNFNVNLTSFTVSGSVLRDTVGIATNGLGGDGLLLNMRGTSVLTSGSVTGSVFTNLATTGIQALTADTARIGNASSGVIVSPAASNSFTIQTSTFTSNNIAIDISQSQQSNQAFQVLSNTMRTHNSHALNVATAAGSDTGPASHFHVGKIDGNVIGIQGTKDSGSRIGNGMRVVIQGQNTQGSVTISNNTIREVVNANVITLFGQNGAGTTGTGSARFNVTGNSLPAPSGSNQNLCGPAATPCAENGIFVLADEAFNVCVNITGNTIYDVSTMNGTADVYLAERTGPPAGAQLTVQTGAAGGNSATVVSYINANNTLAGGANKTIDEGGNTSTVTSCGAFPSGPATFETSMAEPAAAPTRSVKPRPVVLPLSAEAPRAAAPASAAPKAAKAESKRLAGTFFRHTAEDSSAPLNSEPVAAQRRKVKAPVLTDAPGGPSAPGAGGSLSVNVGTLKGGDSVTITFQVTVETPYDGGLNVSNQGRVTGTNFTTVNGVPTSQDNTDDPNAGTNAPGEANPTLTPVNSTDIRVNDATAAEPSADTAQMLFTVTLTQPAPAGGLTVSYATADGTATGGASCDGTVDYVTPTAGSTATVAAGSKTGVIPVTICADGVAGESSETLTLTISNQNSGNIVDPTATGTITQGNPEGTLMISELRTSGPDPDGVGPLTSEANDYVELYNNTDADKDISGYGLFKKGTDCNATPVLVATIPGAAGSSTTVIKARGHYLITGSSYSLKDYGGLNAAKGDLELATEVAETDANVGLFSTADANLISTATKVDAVGFGTGGANAGGTCDLLREGTNLPPIAAASTTEHAFFRKLCDFVGGVGCTAAGNPKDTNDNSADFLFVDTQATSIPGVPQKLGAPGPENTTSPIRRDTSGIGLPLLDGSKPASAVPNRFRTMTSSPANNSTFGTLTIRRRVVNNTAGDVTRLRFRIIELTTKFAPPGTADLRARTGVIENSGDPGLPQVNDPATCGAKTPAESAPCNVTVLPTTLEEPPAQPIGGGFNSTLSAGTVTLLTPLGPGKSLNVNFLLGIQQTGTFRFLVIIEALP